MATGIEFVPSGSKERIGGEPLSSQHVASELLLFNKNSCFQQPTLTCTMNLKLAEFIFLFFMSYLEERLGNVFLWLQLLVKENP